MDFIKELNTEIDIETYIKKLKKAQLIKIIKILNNSYYGLEANSLVSDTIYDLLKDELEIKDPMNKLLSQIDTSVSIVGKKKIKLPIHMGSMNKIKNNQQNKLDLFIKNNNNKEYIITPKFDGISTLLYHQDDQYILCTRGTDGKYGTNISHLISYLFTKSYLEYLSYYLKKKNIYFVVKLLYL